MSLHFPEYVWLRLRSLLKRALPDPVEGEFLLGVSPVVR